MKKGHSKFAEGESSNSCIKMSFRVFVNIRNEQMLFTSRENLMSFRVDRSGRSAKGIPLENLFVTFIKRFLAALEMTNGVAIEMTNVVALEMTRKKDIVNANFENDSQQTKEQNRNIAFHIQLMNEMNL